MADTTDLYATAAGLMERTAAAFGSGVPEGTGDDGLFGPASITWRMSADLVSPVAALRCLLMQALHPLAAGVDQHSGSWRVDPARSQASFTARGAGRSVRGRMPLTGRVLITEPIEDSTVRLAARTSAISTGSRWLDRLLAGPSFLDAEAFPEVSFRSELLAWVPAGWRAVGRLQVKGNEHELACRFDLRLDDPRPGCLPRLLVAGSLAIDSRWVTRQRIPALDRRIAMTCSLSLEPNI